MYIAVRPCASTYRDVCCHMQDTADTNYMLLTTVVNGHNCVAIRHCTATQHNTPQARFERQVVSVYVRRRSV